MADRLYAAIRADSRDELYRGTSRDDAVAAAEAGGGIWLSLESWGWAPGFGGIVDRPRTEGEEDW